LFAGIIIEFPQREIVEPTPLADCDSYLFVNIAHGRTAP
jgi:hypothetical protein